MNTLKPLLIAAVLAGIGYGVYVRINGGDDAPPPGAPESWDAAPKVDLPEATASNPASPFGGGGGAAPPFGSMPVASANTAPPAGDSAPPFAPNAAPPAGPDSLANTAPPASVEMPQVPAGDVAPLADRYQQPAGDSSAPPSDVAAVPVGTPNDPAGASAHNSDLAERYRSGVTQPPAGDAAPAAEGSFAPSEEAARHELESGQFASALQRLSAWHNDPRLSPQEQQRLGQLLDQVAGTVVYSTQHLMEPPYEVQPNERLEDIAQKYSIPWELLAKINGIDDPANLRPGERLKVVRGPFSAMVNLDKMQITLLTANGSYAGRFNIGVGREHPPREGVYSVSDKVVNPVYHGPDRAVAAGDQGNPLGGRWIGLGSELGIHGTDRPDNIGRNDLSGSISLGPRDVEDVFDILSVGSRVVVRR